MASHLHSEGYHLAAASIAGAVLEDSLRQLCAKHDVTWNGDSSINKLNEALRNKRIYAQEQWREIQFWGDLRNKVDHHRFVDPDDIDRNQVERMIDGIRHFVVKYLT